MQFNNDAFYSVRFLNQVIFGDHRPTNIFDLKRHLLTAAGAHLADDAKASEIGLILRPGLWLGPNSPTT